MWKEEEKKNSGYHTITWLTHHHRNAYIHQRRETTHNIHPYSRLGLSSLVHIWAIFHRHTDTGPTLDPFYIVQATSITFGSSGFTPRAAVTARTPFDSGCPITGPAATFSSDRLGPFFDSSATRACRPTTERPPPRPQWRSPPR